MGLKAIIGHTEPSGTHGGDSVLGAWRQRTINTKISDPDNLVTLSANEFTLQAGTYLIKVAASFWDSNRAQSVLYDVTGSTILVAGSNEYVTTYNVQSEGILFHAVSLTSANTYSIQSQVQLSATKGFGFGNSFPSSTNSYVVVEIEKLTASDEVAVICDEKAYNVDGGDFTQDAWRTRDLNTVRFDPNVLVSLSANEFTLQAGTYVLESSAPGYDVDRQKTRLQNITDGVTVAHSPNEASNSHVFYARSNNCILFALFALTAAKALSLQNYCSQTQNTNGFGVATDFDVTVPSVYAQVLIRKIAE